MVPSLIFRRKSTFLMELLCLKMRKNDQVQSHVGNAVALIASIDGSFVFTFVTLLKGQYLREARTKVKTFQAGTCYWPFVSFINFRFMLLSYRSFARR